MKTKKFMWIEINFVLGRNGSHKPSDLGIRLIVVIRQEDIAVHNNGVEMNYCLHARLVWS